MSLDTRIEGLVRQISHFDFFVAVVDHSGEKTGAIACPRCCIRVNRELHHACNAVGKMPVSVFILFAVRKI